MLIISIACDFLPVALPGRLGGGMLIGRFNRQELYIFNMLRNVLRCQLIPTMLSAISVFLYGSEIKVSPRLQVGER
jgi:hypothetical protein